MGSKRRGKRPAAPAPAARTLPGLPEGISVDPAEAMRYVAFVLAHLDVFVGVLPQTARPEAEAFNGEAHWLGFGGEHETGGGLGETPTRAAWCALKTLLDENFPRMDEDTQKDIEAVLKAHDPDVTGG